MTKVAKGDEVEEPETQEMSINTGASISVPTSVKGIKTYRVTVYGKTGDEALAESNRLVDELDKRYPPNIEKE